MTLFITYVHDRTLILNGMIPHVLIVYNNNWDPTIYDKNSSDTDTCYANVPNEAITATIPKFDQIGNTDSM